jgi:sugar lactone lactonase YvrE
MSGLGRFVFLPALTVLIGTAVPASAGHAPDAPVAEISFPQAGAAVDGFITVSGTARATHFDSYDLQVITGRGIRVVVDLTTGLMPVNGGRLGDWNTRDEVFDTGSNIIRLTVHERNGSSVTTEVEVFIDRTFPSLTSFTATPSPAPIGNVQFQVQVSETLKFPPSVVANGVAATFVSQSGLTYNFNYPVTAATPQGTVPVAITLTDRADHVTNASASFVVDRIPPAAVTNLAANSTMPDRVTLSWTAPSDNGPTGRAASYEIRYAQFAITSSNFSTAIQALNAPTPASAGTAQNLEITGLQANRRYYFALVSRDTAGNRSDLSNVPSWVVFTDVTPPVTDIVVSGPRFDQAGQTFIAPATTIGFSSQDSESGVSRTEYRVDGGAFQTFSSPFSLPAGLHSVEYRSVDQAGNTEALKRADFNVDGTPPATQASLSQSVTLSPTSFAGNASSRLSFTAQDGGSGVASTLFQVDGGGFNPYASPVALAAGVHTVDFHSADRVQNTEPVRSIQVTIDTQAPSITGLTPSGGRFMPGQMITVGFSVSDNHDSSPMVEAFLTDQEEGTRVPVSHARTIDPKDLDDGFWTLTVQATDWVGNSSQMSGAAFEVVHDNLPPRTTLVVGDPRFGADPVYLSASTPLTLTAADDALTPGDGNGVGVDRTFYSLDGGPEQAFTGPFTVPGEGSHIVRFYSVDTLGHREAAQTASIVTDNTPPVTTPSVSHSVTLSPTSFAGNASSRLSFTAQDGGSGVASTLFQVDTGGFNPYANPVALADGVHTVDFHSADRVQNTEPVRSIQVTIDTQAPSITGLTPSGGRFMPGDMITIGFSVSDVHDSSPMVEAFLTDQEEGTRVPVSHGRTIDPKDLDDGFWTLTVQATDWVGNSSQMSGAAFEVVHDNLPPRTTLVVGEPRFGADPVYLSASTPLTLTAADDALTPGDGNGVGVDRTFYLVDNEPEQTYSGPFTLSSEGLHSVRFYSVDTLGHREAAQTMSLTVDATPPTVDLSHGEPFAQSGGQVYVSPATLFTLTAHDPISQGAASGLKHSEWGLNPVNFTVYTAPFSLPEGVQMVHFRATDNVNNAAAPSPETFYVDGTAPVSTLQVGSPQVLSGNMTVVKSATPLSLSAADPLGAGVSSGVRNLFADKGQGMQPVTGPLFLTGADGIYDVNFFAEDLVRNREAVQTRSLGLDNTPPVSSLSFVGPGTVIIVSNTYVTAGNMSVQLSADDPVMAGVRAGVDQIFYSVDNARLQVYSAPFKLATGPHQLRFFANDRLANTEAARTVQVLVVDTPPVTTLVVGDPKAQSGNILYVAARTQISFTASSLAGQPDTFYRVGGQGAFVRFTGSFALPEGIRTVEFYSVDPLGNQEPVRSQTLHVDATPPTSQAAIGDPKFVRPGEPTVIGPQTPISLAATDPVSNQVASGVGKTFYRLAGAPGFTAYSPPAFFVPAVEGLKTIEFYSEDQVANAETVKTLQVIVDSAGPLVNLISPSPNSRGLGRTFMPGQIPVIGSVADATLERYTVSFASAPGKDAFAGGPYTVIVESSRAVPQPGILAIWDARALAGWFTLKLSARDTLGNETVKRANVFLGAPERVLSIGRREMVDYNLQAVRSVAVDGQGNIYVGQVARGISKFGPNGSFLGTLGESLKLIWPSGLAVDPAGHLYVADRYGHRVMKLTPQGHPVFTLGKMSAQRHIEKGSGPGEFNEPAGLALDQHGNIYVADRRNSRVQKFSSSGRFLAEFDLNKCSPLPHAHEDVTGDEDSEHCDLYQAQPRGIAVDGDGRMFVTDDRHSRLIVLSPEGKLLAVVGQEGKHPGSMRMPTAVLVDSANHVYVADTGNMRIQRFDSNFNTVLLLGPYRDRSSPLFFLGANGLALNGDGRLYLSDGYMNFVKVLDSPGSEPAAPATAQNPSNRARGALGPDKAFRLGEVYSFPNPVRSGQHPTVHAEMGWADRWEVRIYDLSGNLVHEAGSTEAPVTVDDGQGVQYAYEYRWDTSDVASGVYICVVQGYKAGQESLRSTSKVAVIK